MDGRITGFFEKSCSSPSRLASMGIYIFNRDVLESCLSEDFADPGSLHDFGYSILPQAVKNQRVFAYMFGGYWRDIGTIDTYYETNLDINKSRPRLTMGGDSPVLTCDSYSVRPCLGSQGNVTDSVISTGCIIRGRVENSVLSPGVCVDEGVFVRDSIIMGNVFISRDSVIDGAILDEWVKIGARSYIGLGHVPSAADETVTVLGQGVTISPDTLLECKRKVQLESVTRPLVFTSPVTPLVQNGEISPVEA
jgi:glucose-1-phosphate adenylyltransferase